MDQTFDSAALQVHAPLGAVSTVRRNVNHGARTVADFFNGLAHHALSRKNSNDIAARLRAECRYIQLERAAQINQQISLQSNS